jgi:hypothetical protein
MPEVSVPSPVAAVIVRELGRGVPIFNEPVRNLTFQELQNYFVSWKEDRKSSVSSQEQAEIEDAYNVIFNIFMVDQEATSRLGGDHKVDAARKLKGAVHSIYSASLKKADPEFSQAMYLIVATCETLAGALRDQEGDTAKLINWRGVEAEVAMMRALKNNGYQVFIPDPFHTDSAGEEMKSDVFEGVDMYIKIDKTAVLINVKGDGRIAAVDFRDIQRNVNRPKYMTQAMQDLGINSYKKLHVVLPTRELIPARLSLPIDETENARSMLARFGLLQPDTQSTIARTLKGIVRRK